MRQFISRLRYSTWTEVRHSWPLLLFVAGLVVAYALAVLAGGVVKNRDGADQVRYFGTWLQLFGIALVAQGVSELRRDFNRPGIFAAMRGRIRAIFRSFSRNQTVVLTGVGIAMGGSTAGAYGRVGGTIEQRLDGLEREIDAMRKQADEREQKTETKLTELRGELTKEKQERTEADTVVTRKLDNVAVGGLYLDVIGLWWLVFATVATSVPDGVVWVWSLLTA